MSMRTYQILEDVVAPLGIELVAPQRPNETVDVILVKEEWTLRISLKTASFHHKTLTDFSGYNFKLGKALRYRHCDMILANIFPFEDDQLAAFDKRAKAIVVFDEAAELYREKLKAAQKSGVKRPSVQWNKKERLQDTYALDDVDRVHALQKVILEKMVLNSDRKDEEKGEEMELVDEENEGDEENEDDEEDMEVCDEEEDA
jgi:hypothetical protein